MKNVLGTAVNGVAAAVVRRGVVLRQPRRLLAARRADGRGRDGGEPGGRAVWPAACRPAVMRKTVAIIGFALAGYYFWKQWQP